MSFRARNETRSERTGPDDARLDPSAPKVAAAPAWVEEDAAHTGSDHTTFGDARTMCLKQGKLRVRQEETIT